MQSHGLRRHHQLVGIASRKDQDLAVWIRGIGSNGHRGAPAGCHIQSRGQGRGTIADQDHVALGNGSD